MRRGLDQRKRPGPGTRPTEAEVDAVTRLADRLMREIGPEAAIRAGVDTMFEDFGTPTAGAMRHPHVLAALYERGIRREASQVVRSAMSTDTGAVPAQAFRDPALLIVVADAGPARLVSLDATGRAARTLRRVARLVRAALERPALPDEGTDPGMGLAWTAHEIRGPLVGVSAAIGSVLSGEEMDEQEDLLRRSKDELEHLADLVDPLLRLSPGAKDRPVHRADLVEVVHHTLQSPEFERVRDHVVVACGGRVPVSGDEDQLRVAVANLIRNALDYAPRGSPVIVTTTAGNGVGLVSVLDGGPGIEAEQVRMLFQPYAGDRSKSCRRGGAGLGLYISRRIVEAHGGRISYEPWAGGSVFKFELPLNDAGGSPSAS